MVYEVPKSKASIEQNQWSFKVPDREQPDVEAAVAADPDLFAEYEELRKKWEAHQADFSKPARGALKVPKLQFIKPTLMRQMDAMTNRIDRVYALLENYHPGIVDLFEGLDQVEAFYAEWAKASGITVGESKGSSAS